MEYGRAWRGTVSERRFISFEVSWKREHGVRSQIVAGVTVRRVSGYFSALLTVAVVTCPLWLLRASLTWANISLIYVLVILGLAIWLGTGPSLLAAVTSFFASEFFLLKPLY